MTRGGGKDVPPVDVPVVAHRSEVSVSLEYATSTWSAGETDTIETTSPVTGPLPVTTIILPATSDLSIV